MCRNPQSVRGKISIRLRQMDLCLRDSTLQLSLGVSIFKLFILALDFVLLTMSRSLDIDPARG